MASSISMVIADNEYFEKVFVELSTDNEAWGIVSQDQLPLTLIIYPSVSGNPWTFNVDEVIDALQRAKQRLLTPTEKLPGA